MGRRAKVTSLPSEVLEELNSRLVRGGFQDYAGLSDWLAECGYKISKSALHTHGQGLEEEFNEAMADARRSRALAQASREAGGDDGALMAAASEVLQDQLLRISVALRRAELEPAEAARTLSQVGRAFADIGRMTISHQKWQAEGQAKLAALEAESNSGGGRRIDAETLRIVREEIYGIGS